jgi:hypothetical protein
MGSSIMKQSIALLLACAAIALAATAHAAPKCPADPVAASRRIWPGNTISAGKLQTADHPCGQRLECTGGNGTGSMKRSCRWAN